MRGLLRIGVLTVALLAILLPGRLAVAQDVTEPALKAAFIYNFARFTTWPADQAPADSFTICVLNDAAVTEALQRAVAGRSLTDRPVVVTAITASAPKRGCRVLYVAGLSVAQVARRLGYADASSFSRAFQKWTSASPGSYRLRHQEIS